MRNIIKYYNHPKKFSHTKKLKYAVGLGDFIAVVLHSKLVGPLTYLITGQFEPCAACSQRRMALNILFPIPFWKLFFKDIDEYHESLKKDYEKAGIHIIDGNAEPKNNPPEQEQPSEPVSSSRVYSIDELVSMSK